MERQNSEREEYRVRKDLPNVDYATVRCIHIRKKFGMNSLKIMLLLTHGDVDTE